MIGNTFFPRMNLSARDFDFGYGMNIDTRWTTTTRTRTASRLGGRHFARRSARSWSGSVLKPRVNKLWRLWRLVGEGTNERAASYPTGQLTKPAKRNPPTGKAESLVPSVPRLRSGFCSSLFFLPAILSGTCLSKNNSPNIIYSVVSLLRDTFSAGSRSACDVDDNRYRLSKGLGSCKQCQFSFVILV